MPDPGLRPENQTPRQGLCGANGCTKAGACVTGKLRTHLKLTEHWALVLANGFAGRPAQPSPSALVGAITFVDCMGTCTGCSKLTRRWLGQ